MRREKPSGTKRENGTVGTCGMRKQSDSVRVIEEQFEQAAAVTFEVGVMRWNGGKFNCSC